jgi:hypothetical protein
MSRLRRPPPVRSFFEEAEGGEDGEEGVFLPPAGPRTFKGFLQKNQVLVSLLQYASTACVMFIPSSYRYYELAAEGCYSLSQVIQYFNRIIIESTVEKCGKLEDLCVVLTRGISHVEVLVEKGAGALIGTYGRTQAIMIVECLKSCLRLLVIINRRAPSLLIHWERDKRPEDPKLDLAHYARWYRLTYAHHVTGGRSSDDIIDAHTGVVTELPPMADATRALDSETANEANDNRPESESVNVNESDSGNERQVQGGGRGNEEVVLTGPIVGRRSGINIRALRIPKPAAPNSDSYPEFGIHDSLNPQRLEDSLPLAQPVLPSRRADTDGDFRYLPHTVSAFTGDEANSSPDTDTERSSSGQTREEPRNSRTIGKGRSSPSSGGFFSFLRRRVGPHGSDSSESSGEDENDEGDDNSSDGDGGDGSGGSEGGRDDTFDRDMYVALGGSHPGRDGDDGAGSADNDDDAAGFDTPRKPPREGEAAANGQASGGAPGAEPGHGEGPGGGGGGPGGGGDHRADTAPDGSGGDHSRFLDETSEGGLSAERCIYLGELLYVLRPAVYAWAVHYVGTHMQSATGAAGMKTGAGADAAYDSDEDDWATPAAPTTPTPTLSRAGLGASGGSGGEDENATGQSSAPEPTPGAARFLPAFAAAMQQVPALAYIATDAHDLQRAVGVTVSFLVEVLAVQLTARGLYLSRARGVRAFHRASPHPEVDPQATIKAITTLYPHSFDTELGRRRTALFFYLIRTPIFDRSTLPLLQLASRMLSRIPLISSLPEHVIGMLSYLNRTHFYSSSSS